MSYPYAAAAVKASENKIISYDRLLKIAESATANDSLRALLETSYGGSDISDPRQFEELIQKELERTHKFIYSIAPDISILNVFLIRNDYHNIKVLLKLEAKNEPLREELLKNNGTVPKKTLIAAVSEKKYDNLTPQMAETLKELNRQLSLNDDISLIGLNLDSSYGLELSERLKKLKSPFVREYMNVYADYTNLLSLIRIRNMDQDLSALKKVLLPFGIMDIKTFLFAFDTPIDSLVTLFCRGIYEKRFSAAFDEFRKNGSLYAFEKSRDEFLLEIIRKYRNDYTSCALFLSYLISKEREAENIRVIMSGKLNGIDNATILSMLKEIS